MFTDRLKKRVDSSTFRPIREMEEIRRRLDDELVRPVLHAVWDRIPEEMKSWAPSMDVFEKGDKLVIKIELPGMKRENIELSVTDNSLTIKGRKEPESGIKEEDYYRSEIAYGSIHRSLDLPFNVDTKKVEAVYDDGILQVTLERAEGSKPKVTTIQIKQRPT